jgi:hypothetical protein
MSRNSSSTHLVRCPAKEMPGRVDARRRQKEIPNDFLQPAPEASIKFIIWPADRHGYFAARLDSGRAIIAAFDVNHQSVEFFPTVSAAGAALPSRMQGVLS